LSRPGCHHPLGEPGQIRGISALGFLPVARTRHAIQTHVAAVGKKPLIIEVGPEERGKLDLVVISCWIILGGPRKKTFKSSADFEDQILRVAQMIG